MTQLRNIIMGNNRDVPVLIFVIRILCVNHLNKTKTEYFFNHKFYFSYSINIWTYPNIGSSSKSPMIDPKRDIFFC